MTERERRNAIVIMSDTFRRDHLAAYGPAPPWTRRNGRQPFIETPALDRLFAESAAFDAFYVSSYPTVPCRTDLFTGRWSFPRRGWAPLGPGDRTLAEILGRNGWVTQIIFDTPMLAVGDYNFHRGFTGWDFIRGQHGDAWDTAPIDPPLPAAPWKLRDADATRRYLRHTRHRQGEADWMCARTLARATEWLDDNHKHRGFLLWVDTWDPHEPFDAPDQVLSRYLPPGDPIDRVIYPQYGRPSLSDDDIDFVRGSYAGLVEVVDRWTGRLLEKVDELGLRESTMVVFLTDHGHLFGEHDLEGKPTGPLGWLYEPTIRIPFLLRHPDGLGQGTRVEGIAQHVDLLPTILEFLGLPVPADVEGRSLLPMLTGLTGGREFAVSGRRGEWRGEAVAYDGAAGRAGLAEPLTATDREFSLLCGPLGKRELFNHRKDPGQTTPLPLDQAVVERLEGGLFELLRSCGAPDGLIQSYLPSSTARYTAAVPERIRLYSVTPEGDRTLAFVSPADASRCLDRPAVDDLEATTAADLLERDPPALVYLDQQYYWLSDLLEAPWSELLVEAT